MHFPSILPLRPLLVASSLVVAVSAVVACSSSDSTSNSAGSSGTGNTAGTSATGGSGGSTSAGAGGTSLVGDAAHGKLVAEGAKPVCTSCHGADYSGGGYYPNITNDMDTGIGSWTDDQIRGAIRNGVDDEGETLCAEMPRFSTTSFSDSDLTDLVAFLRSLSVKHEITMECPDEASPPPSGK